VRSRAALVVAGALAVGLVATASIGEAHTRKPKLVCQRRHHRRVCRTAHIKPHRRVTTTTTTSTASGSTRPATAGTTSGSATTSTTATQTTTTQTTTTTSSSTSAALPHGTEVDERATGQQSPFYAMDANEHTLAAGTIRFNIYNYDQDPHTLAIADSSGQQISDTVPVPAGQTGTAVTLTVTLAPGTYVLFCTLPQHAADGMKTTIVVK
jgi:plastocyanin